MPSCSSDRRQEAPHLLLDAGLGAPPPLALVLPAAAPPSSTSCITAAVHRDALPTSASIGQPTRPLPRVTACCRWSTTSLPPTLLAPSPGRRTGRLLRAPRPCSTRRRPMCSQLGALFLFVSMTVQIVSENSLLSLGFFLSHYFCSSFYNNFGISILLGDCQFGQCKFLAAFQLLKFGSTLYSGGKY